jgi:hypothetical protein
VQSNSDPSSLNNLNGIVLPPEVPWWPLAPGWYVLAGVLLLLLCWFLIRTFQRHRRNRYRRSGLAELNSLRLAGAPDSVMGIPPLLKRVALAAYPRKIVASASGREWARILDHTAGTEDFESRIGSLLDQAAYQDDSLDEAGRNELFRAAEQWIRSHRAEAF